LVFFKNQRKTHELWLFLALFEVFGLILKIKKPEEIWLFLAFLDFFRSIMHEFAGKGIMTH